jgi:hypothetical protein
VSDALTSNQEVQGCTGKHGSQVECDIVQELRSLVQVAFTAIRTQHTPPADWFSRTAVALGLRNIRDEPYQWRPAPESADEGWREHSDGTITVADITLRPAAETRAVTRDADHCDFPDCEQHYKYLFLLALSHVDMGALQVSHRKDWTMLTTGADARQVKTSESTKT